MKDIEDDANAARDPRVARRPDVPTKAMVLAHELHHAEYRDWCEHCVAGKGVTHPHRSSEKNLEIAEFSIDYGFMTSEGAQLDDGIDRVGASPVLVGYDHRSKGVWAMAVDRKGPTPSSVQ